MSLQKAVRGTLWLLAGCTGGLDVFSSPPGATGDDRVIGRPTGVADAPDSPGEDPETSAPPPCRDPSAARSLCLSELQSDNESTAQRAPGVFGDWLELVHLGETPIPAGEVVVRVGDDAFLLTGDDLQPGERRVVWLGDEAGLPGLSDGGETVRIEVTGALLDEVEAPPLSADTAYALQPDGAWATTCSPSPGDPNPPTDGCSDARDWVFADGRIHEFRLYLDAAAFDTLQSSELFVYPTAAGRLVFAGGEFPAVEVELKGGYGSFRGDLTSQKTGFKFDLRSALSTHGWRGLEKITLNNMVQDPTFVHEPLTYDLYRLAGVPAPRVSYARLWVNDEYFGFYALIEAVDDRFLETFVGGGGHLLEAAYGPDFDPGDAAAFEYDEGPDEAAGRARVESLAMLLRDSPWDESTLAVVDGLVDLDQVMLAMAVEAATWNWDGYTTENNSYWYTEPATGRWILMPHGVDQTWTAGWPNPWDDNERPVLYDFCLRVPSCRQRYADALRHVADTLDAANLVARFDALVALTDPEFAADPRKEDAGGRAPQLEATRARLLTAADALRAAAGP